MNAPALANLDAERAFLGAVASQSELEGPEPAKRALEQSLVTPERLFLPAHRALLGEVEALLAAGQPATATALAARLSASAEVRAEGGLAWLSKILGDAPVPGEVPLLADAVRQAALRRLIVARCQEGIAKAQDAAADPAATLLEVSGALAGVTLSKRTIRSLGEVMLDAIEEMEARASGNARPPPSTGLAVLDGLLGGLPPTLIVVGAMPGVGKSAFLATVAQSIARNGGTVGLFSLEDEARWLAWRLWSDESGVPQFVLRNRALSDGQRRSAAEGASKIGSYAERVLIDDRGGLSPKELVQTARDMVVNRGASVIMVDHLGELRFDGRHRERFDLEVAEGLSDLREIAKRHRVPVVVACHLRRREGLTPDTEPRLTDFANSAACERQARVALGLSREAGSDTLRIAILKNTNGLNGRSVEVRFVGVAAMVRNCEGELATDFYQESNP